MRDFSRSNFLIDEKYYGSTITEYRRRKNYIMFDAQDKPMRKMSLRGWQEFKKEFPKEVEEDGLYVKEVWVLEEVKQ